LYERNKMKTQSDVLRKIAKMIYKEMKESPAESRFGCCHCFLVYMKHLKIWN